MLSSAEGVVAVTYRIGAKRCPEWSCGCAKVDRQLREESKEGEKVFRVVVRPRDPAHSVVNI